jgi:Putative peptidoglycan binding domain
MSNTNERYSFRPGHWAGIDHDHDYDQDGERGRSVLLFCRSAMMKAALGFCAIWLSVATGQSVLGQNAAGSVAPGQSAGAPPLRMHRPAKNQVIRPPSKNFQSTVPAKPGPRQQPALSFSDAQRRVRHERHDRAWWKSRYRTIVFVTGGYYYWDAGYWFPAWGYDPLYDNYDYDGPIYTYGNLLPDQVIINVQRALQQLGYYPGGLTGSIGPATRAAIAAYQEDAGLFVTGGIDAPTVASLGLY